MTKYRNKVADFWDAYANAWIKGDDALEAWIKSQGQGIEQDLHSWQASYVGKGRGSLDLNSIVDPFTGDLRGINGEPLIVTLGLNPGIAYPEMQDRSGIWTKRIANSSLSKCFDRSPPGDQDWMRLHGKESAYWRNLLRFGSRWHGVEFGMKRLLNFELYPWHSNSLTSKIDCPPEIVDRYIFQPLSEMPVSHAFAFGRDWDDICTKQGMRQVCRYGDGFKDFPGPSSPGWSVAIYKASSMDVSVIVSWQKGYAGPPGSPRIETLKEVVHRELG